MSLIIFQKYADILLIGLSNLAVELFGRHLFPKAREQREPVPRILLNTDTRSKICDIISRIAQNKRSNLTRILLGLNEVVPYFARDEGKFPQLTSYEDIG